MSFLFIFMLMFCSVWAQVLCGSYGVLVPFAAVTVFYVSVTYGWRVGIIAALVQGSCIDLLYCRNAMFSPLVLLFIVLLAELWLLRADDKAVWMRVVPGAIIGIVCVLPQSLYNIFTLGANPDLLLQGWLSFIFSLMISCVLLPVMILWLDGLAERLGVARFGKAREKIIHRR